MSAGSYVDVPGAHDLADGEMVAMEIDGYRIAVAKHRGMYFAFDDTCTHAACSLSEGDVEEGTVVCPCHLGAFELTTGEVMGGPPPTPIAIHEVRIEDGHVAVRRPDRPAAP